MLWAINSLSVNTKMTTQTNLKNGEVVEKHVGVAAKNILAGKLDSHM